MVIRCRMFLGLLLAGVIVSASISQTNPPTTDIYLVSMTVEQGQTKFGTPKNITNRNGYDNQPSFTTDGKYLFFTSIRDDRQADTYKYELESRSITRVTTTAESEYSPTFIPGEPSFSVVRVELDSTQRLWKFGLDGTNPSLVFPNIKPVGYHAWLDHQTAAVFVLGNPATLRVADTRTGNADSIAASVGRSLHKIPGRRSFSFVHKAAEKEWWIKEYDVDTKTIRALVQTLEGSEDCAWTERGTLLMAKGSKIFEWDPTIHSMWQLVADFEHNGVTSMTRLAVSSKSDWFAFVAARNYSP